MPLLVSSPVCRLFASRWTIRRTARSRPYAGTSGRAGCFWRMPPPPGLQLYRSRREYRRRFPEADRKSTRLNSSHLVISYPVFCFKQFVEVFDCYLVLFYVFGGVGLLVCFWCS